MSDKRYLQMEHRLRRRRRISRIPLKRLKDRQNPLEQFNAFQFKARFHMSKDTAFYIAGLISEKISSPMKRGCQLPPILQFLVTLRFYATGSFQIAIGDLSLLSQGTISNLVKRVSMALAALRPQFIKYPNFTQASALRTQFYEIGNFLGVVGAIDGCQVRINSPGGQDAELFRNRKTYFAINTQGVCDSELNFTNIVARWYGSAHDSRILENSQLFSDLESGKCPGILLGDAGYPCLPFLMPPLRNPLTIAEKRYQRSHLLTRNTIERTFGVWKRKFPCLHHLRLKLNTSLLVIIATAVLHNITRARLDLFENDTADTIDDMGDSTVNCTVRGKAYQRNLILSHFSK